MTKNNEFGRFFRNCRTVLGLNLSEFCRRNGFDKGNVSRLERGLKKPPESPDLLRAYANALQLRPDSDDWNSFMRHAAITRGRLPSAVSGERAADVEEMFRRLGRRLRDSWVKARDLEQWSPSRDAQAGLPTLIRKLIYASTEQPARIEVSGGEGVQRHGWDGVVNAPTTSFYVPAGVSGWEISVEQRPANKAERDFKARKKGPLGLPPSEVTFVFVTSRKWDGKQKWRDEKRELRIWKSVEVYDSSDLEAWLEIAPGVDAWIAERLGRRPPGVVSIGDHWESLSRLCEPRLKPDVFLASRKKNAKELSAFLLGTPGVMPIECRSPMEAVDFVAAYLETIRSDDTEFAMDEDDRIRVGSRTVVVKDRAQWDGLSQAAGQLNLLPIPSLSLTPEELNAAVSHGHRIVVAATQFSNHRPQPTMLSRPSRYDLDEVLCKSGFNRDRAKRASLAAGGSLSVLKRHLSMTPDTQLPDWCGKDELLQNFLPMLLVGAWDDANEVDRDILSRLADRPYGDIQHAAQRLLQEEETPLTRIESRWRLVSPEDSWSLVGRYVTDDLLSSFETIAIKVLADQDGSAGLSADERLRASVMGTAEAVAGPLLRRGISETTAILGSGFGPVAKLCRTRERAESIVRATLWGASYQRWVALGNLLPLLAEAAPNEFLTAISADLKNKNPELAKMLADGDDNYFFSGCKHAGLLWALEGIAWSSELFLRACKTFAQLHEIDTGRTWGGNRPIASLREILLPWHPQTAAGVDKRIEFLKSLAEKTPTVAWKLLFTMMPQALSSADLTHRPIWRDWMSGWREGASDEDYWKQVNAAADLVVRLAGNDTSRWIDVLDKLQTIPQGHRNQLIDRIQVLPADTIRPEERQSLAEKLRKTIRLHRDCADAWWAMPAAEIDRMEQALSALQPDGLCERHAWLFMQSVELPGFRNDFQRMEEEVTRLRAAALREILDKDGFAGVLKLADIVESPAQVGVTLAQTDCVPQELVVPGLLKSSNSKHFLLAGAFVRYRIDHPGWDWVRTLPLDKWDTKVTADLLSQSGLDPRAWTLAETLGEGVVEEYWKAVLIFGESRANPQQLEFACRKLIEATRPESAIGVLSRVTFDEVIISPSIVMDSLTACLEWIQSNPDTQLRDDTVRIVQELLGWLQKNVPFCNDEPTQRLAQLEWAFQLDGSGTYGVSPKTLVRCLSEYPKFFAELIGAIFRSKHDQESETTSTEEQQKKAIHGYRLLRNWDCVPGTQSDGSIDEEQLLRWLESVRSLCRDSGHLEIADSKIGEMLARWPQPKDETAMWPCEQICDAIEEANSDDLDRGFQIGALNSRGATWRSPLDGGDLERKEAAKYRRWAELCDIDWPRTAASLRKVAESYEFSAQREDSRASERAHERH